jgi:lysozyme family protein
MLLFSSLNKRHSRKNPGGVAQLGIQERTLAAWRS